MFKDTLNSNEFYEELRAGNPKSYLEVREYCRLNFRSLYSGLRASWISEDLLSGTMLKLFAAKCSGYDRKKGAFTNWLWTVAQNDVIDFLRHEGTNCQLSDIQIEDPRSNIVTQEEETNGSPS